MNCNRCGAELPDGSDYCFSCGKVQSEPLEGGFSPIQLEQTKERVIMICTMIVTVMFLISGIFKVSLTYVKIDKGDRTMYISMSMDSAVEALIGLGPEKFSDTTDNWSKAVTYIDIGIAALSAALLVLALIQLLKRDYDKAASSVGKSALIIPLAHIANFIYYIHERSESGLSSSLAFSVPAVVLIIAELLVAGMCFRVSSKAFHISINDKYDKGSILGYMPFFTVIIALFLAFGVVCYSYAYQNYRSDYKVSSDLLNNYFMIYYMKPDDFFEALGDSYLKTLFIINYVVVLLSALLSIVAAVMVFVKKNIISLRLAAVSSLLPVIGYICNILFRIKQNDRLYDQVKRFDMEENFTDYKYLFSPVPIIMMAVCIAAAAAAVYSVKTLKKEQEELLTL